MTFDEFLDTPYFFYGYLGLLAIGAFILWPYTLQGRVLPI
jgi:hypothetical protein